MLSTLETESAYRAFNLNLVSELAPLQRGERSPVAVLIDGAANRHRREIPRSRAELCGTDGSPLARGSRGEAVQGRP